MITEIEQIQQEINKEIQNKRIINKTTKQLLKNSRQHNKKEVNDVDGLAELKADLISDWNNYQLTEDLDNWFNEHEEGLGVHKKECKDAISTLQSAMSMVGD